MLQMDSHIADSVFQNSFFFIISNIFQLTYLLSTFDDCQGSFQLQEHSIILFLYKPSSLVILWPWFVCESELKLCLIEENNNIHFQ